jgi:hypothetical protein
MHDTELKYPNSKIRKEIEGMFNARSIYFIALQIIIARSVFSLLSFHTGKLASWCHQVDILMKLDK